MAGYYKFSKSNNAVAAEKSGLMTATALVKHCREKRFFKGITTNHIKEILTPDEWHHTSCKYNKTNYYSVFELFKKRTKLRAAIRGPKESKQKRLFFKCWNIENKDVRSWDWSITNRAGNNLHQISHVLDLLEKHRMRILEDKATHKTKIRVNSETIAKISEIESWIIKSFIENAQE